MSTDTTQQAANQTLGELQPTERRGAAPFLHGEDRPDQQNTSTPRTLMSLPQELRDMVWAEALDPSPEKMAVPPSKHVPLPPMILTSRPPLLAHVCRDSRAFVQERYKAAYGVPENLSTSNGLGVEGRQRLMWVSRSTIRQIHTFSGSAGHITTMGLDPHGSFVLIHDQSYTIYGEVKDQLAHLLPQAQDFQIMMCLGYHSTVWIPCRAAKTFKLPWGWMLGTGRNSPRFVDTRDLGFLQQVLRELDGLEWTEEDLDTCGITRLRDFVGNVKKREEFDTLASGLFKALWDKLNTGMDNDGEVRLNRGMPKIRTVFQFLVMDEPGPGWGIRVRPGQ
ncbi:hypothetical protein B0T20DRAFT_182443 [Sordaria brevicollis]|uniref:2EXR domain-containing protein n=1 Tax=Sordaria brevicollis TaxID=83679 RepID=A0AAE0UDQ0_SORBR|nr:hypothetical protein B0T20DRAFT_182443 [Sordaria brevicollis]